MSKVYPEALNFLALPPRSSFFSITVTSTPAFARYAAELKPAKPLPITIPFFKKNIIPNKIIKAETLVNEISEIPNNNIIEKFPSSNYAVESSVKIGEFLYSKGLYSQAAQQLRLIPRLYPRYPDIERVVNLMSSSFLAIGAEDSLKYYLGIYQSMFPNIIFDEYEISKKRENINLAQKLTLESTPIKPYVIQIGAFGNIQNAKRLKLQVAQIGYNVYIVPIETNGRTFHAVRVLSFKTKSKAEKIGKLIKSKLGVEYRVLYRPKK